MNFQVQILLILMLLVGLIAWLVYGRGKSVRSKRSQLSAAAQALGSDHSTGSESTNKQSFEYGLKLYRLKRFDQSYPILLAHAQRGHPHATSLIVKMYFAGNGVDKDDEQYKYWLEKAAGLGDKAAKAKLKRIQRQT